MDARETGSCGRRQGQKGTKMPSTTPLDDTLAMKRVYDIAARLHALVKLNGELVAVQSSDYVNLFNVERQHRLAQVKGC